MQPRIVRAVGGRRAHLGIVVALAMLVAGGCAASTATSPPVSDTRERSPGTQAPSGFASPSDIFQRYPEMRNQQL